MEKWAKLAIITTAFMVATTMAVKNNCLTYDLEAVDQKSEALKRLEKRLDTFESMLAIPQLTSHQLDWIESNVIYLADNSPEVK